jgi:hypothetical protein
MNAFVKGDFAKTDFGWSTLILVTEGWGEGYVGPTWKPIEAMEVSLSVGMEQTADSVGWRFATSMWIGNDDISFLGILEFSPSVFKGDDTSLWFDLIGMVKVIDWLSCGVIWRRFVGAGVIVSFQIPTKIPIIIWGMWTPLNPEEGIVDGLQPQKYSFGIKGAF